MKKHIICFGDSNTHGYCADPMDCADHGDRFNEDERWTCLLQKALGEDYLVLEEGLSGRTTVFEDPLHESMSGLSVIYSTLMCHEPVDLLVIMLGTNDTKDRFGASAKCIGIGMERLAMKAETVPCWKGGKPNILIIAPPAIGEGVLTSAVADEMGTMGPGCVEKSRRLPGYYKLIAEQTGVHFLDANEIEGVEFNEIDFMHLTRAAHAALAKKLGEFIPTVV